VSLSPQHLVTCGRSFVCGLLLLAQPLPATLGRSVANAPAGRTQTAEPDMLVPGVTLRREIGGSDLHRFAIQLAEGQYARILVTQQGSDVVTTIFNTDGKRTTVDRPNGARGREAISFIAAQGGKYRLEIRTLERAAPRGHYEISVGELRPSTPRDESRLAAEQSVTEGEILRARKTAVSLPQALEKFGQSIALWRALDEPYETAVALYGRCLTRRLLGDNEQAIADCSESARAMNALGEDYGEAVARTGRGWSYIYLGDTNNALADFTSALKIRRRIGDELGEPLDLVGTGWVYALRDDYDKALDYFQQSLRASDPRGRPVRLAAIGEVYRRTNRPAQAIEYLTLSLQLSRAANNDRGGEAETLTSLGWCRYALGQLGQAQENFTDALPIRRAVGDRTGEAISMLGLAHVERAQGNLYNARLHVESALTIVESLRAQVNSQPLRLSFFAMAQDYYEFYIDLLMHMHRLDPGRGYAAAALEISERSRARSLLDLLNESGVDVRQGVPSELLDREREVHANLNSAASYQRQLLSENYTTEQAATASRAVDQLSTTLSEAEAQIRQASPRYAALAQPQPLTAANIQREVADADTLLLEYALGKERSYLWAVSPATITAYELPGRREIEQVAVRAHELLTARNRSTPGETAAQRRARIEEADNQYEEASARLSRMLLAPAAPQFGARRLLIVAPGVLQFTAFSALPSPPLSTLRSFRGNTPLIVSHEIITLPSASILAMLRREPARRSATRNLVAILADPVFSPDDERLTEISSRTAPVSNTSLNVGAASVTTGMGDENNDQVSATGDAAQSYRLLPRMFRTRWEAEQIAALTPPGSTLQVLDFDANREAATGAGVSESRIVHFATHAIINNEHPELSGIALSMFDRNGRQQDGFLRAHDIFNLKLSADLVVLSACRTALGRDFKGEGLVGLARGFMYAGTPRIVGSLWSINDKATAELMVRFYRRMLKENLRAGAALRAAQVEMWRDKRWQAPYYWAGFTLQGEWQ
jgi:CHAT domain-containing protein/tetratricopeptide (TPR) repeat protein